MTTSQSFNLPAPPGFVGFDEQKALRIYKRHLPHWRQDGVSYAVTFRLADALPQSKLQELKRHRAQWEQETPEPRDEEQWKQFAQEVTRMAERWLDEGYGACPFRDPTKARIMFDAMRFYEDTRCRVPCLTIMPNHVHAVMTPYRDYNLEDVLQRIKGWTARQLNLSSGNSDASGSLWAEESYDRIIRDEEHLYRVVQYIGRNGNAAGLAAHEYLRWMSCEWESAGWGFRDDSD